MSALEQDRERADIRSERSQGWRSERSRGNLPVACLSGKRYFGKVPLQKRLPPYPQRDLMMPPALRDETHLSVDARRESAVSTRFFAVMPNAS